jgi:hypothetical protein
MEWSEVLQATDALADMMRMQAIALLKHHGKVLAAFVLLWPPTTSTTMMLW